MESAMQLYNAEPHEHLGHGLTLVLPLAVAFAAGIALGRFMTGKKDLRRFQERLDSLSGAIENHRRKIGRCVLWKMRAELVLKSYSVAICLLLIAAVYFGYSHELVHCYEIPLGCVLLGGAVWVVAKGLEYRIRYNLELVRLLEVELVESKKNIIKELGSEMIQELRASDKCSKLCEDRKKAVAQDLERHKWLITELSNFTWCEGCSRESRCSDNCGGRYWRFTKEALRKFHTFQGSSNRSS